MGGFLGGDALLLRVQQERLPSGEQIVASPQGEGTISKQTHLEKEVFNFLFCGGFGENFRSP